MMTYMLAVIIIIGILTYVYLKKKKHGSNEKPDNNGSHTEITVKVPIESKGYIVENGTKKEVTIKYMPQGLQVFDEKGNCVLDITSRLTRIVDVIHITEREFTRIYDIPKGTQLWWAYSAQSDTKPIDDDYDIGFHAPNVYIRYESPTRAIIDVDNANVDNYFFIGVV